MQTEQGLHWGSGLSQSTPSSGSVFPAASSAVGKHLCSLASSAALSVLGDDRQALFLLENFTAPEMLI